MLPEPQLHEILRLNNYSPQSYLIDRYIVTVILANGKLLTSKDYQYATDPQFRQLYFDDNALMKVTSNKYAGRFDRLRTIINKNKAAALQFICEEEAIKRAIDRHGKNIMNLSVENLSQEFGNNVFNAEYLNQAIQDFGLAAQDEWGIQPTLWSIVNTALSAGNYRENSKSSVWPYLKCLLRVFQSDERTRNYGRGVIGNEYLEP